MKKIIGGIIGAAAAVACAASLAGCAEDTIYVDTNAFFAPFEYYEGDEIKGVDVDIMELVGKKLDKKVKFENTDFDIIIDNVADGSQYDCGAAGITITPERSEKVAFSKPYYTSVQYVIIKSANVEISTVSKGEATIECIYWDSLMNKNLGVQLDTTGDIYAIDEIENGVLKGMSKDKLKEMPDAMTAVADLDLELDAVIVDELPAKYIVKKDSSLKCYPLYYSNGDATEEQYAICVNKENKELLNAINEVLDELGEDGVNALVSKHFGLN